MLVAGLGAHTGIVTSLFSAGYGATVTATDEKLKSELGDAPAKLRAAVVTLALGSARACVVSRTGFDRGPSGVPANLPSLELARARAELGLWSEIELAWRFLRGKLVAITGSNGKTTTTSLVAHILKTASITTQIGGNIGTPLLRAHRAPRTPL